jgi:hypothetical protein
VGEVANTAVKSYETLGTLGFLIVAMVLAFCFLVWRIVITQDKMLTTLDCLYSKYDTMSALLTAHDRQGQQIGDTLDKAGDCLTSLKTQVAEMKGMIR